MVLLHHRSITPNEKSFADRKGDVIDRMFRNVNVAAAQSARSFLLVIAGLCLSIALMAQEPANIKSWLPANGGDWNLGANWSGGSVPAAGDDVFISVAQTAPITAVPTITLKSLNITASCQLEGPTTATTITLNGSLSINDGVVLTLGNNKLSISLGANSSSNIQGTLSTLTELAVNPGTVLSMGPNGMITGSGRFSLNAGGTLRIGSVNGIAAGNLNSGNIQVSGIRTYSAGAHYVYNGSSNQSTGDGFPSALTGSLTIDNPNTVTIVAATRTITTGTLILLQGTFATNNGANRLFLGNSTTAATATLRKGAGVLTGALQGTNWYTVEYIGNDQSTGLELGGAGFRNMTLTMNPGQSLTLDASRTIPGVLTLNSGILNTSTNTLIISGNASASIIGGSASTYVAGNLQRAIAAGSGTYSFPVGAGNGYAPVSLSFGAGTIAGNLAVLALSTDHPNLSSALQINAAKSVNRHWRLGVVSGLTTANYSATFNWNTSDEDAGFDFNNAVAALYNGSTWNYPTLGVKAQNNIQLLGQTTFGDFQIGKFCDPTVISLQPLPAAICPGESASLRVGVTGAALSFQWSRNGEAIPGATDSIYSANQGGEYAVTVSGDCGAVTSAVAKVTVKAATLINAAPVGGTICAADSLLMSVSASGEGTLTYQWKLEGNPIIGANQASYYAKVAGNYTVDVTANCGTVTSQVAAVTYKAPTTIETEPASGTICEGGNWLFRVNASGEGVLSYQWYRNNNPIAGATAFDYSATQSGSYKVSVTATCGTVNSKEVTLVVNDLTTIQSQPNDQEISYGDNAQFSVQASGTGTLSYQWQVNSGTGWANLADGAGYNNTAQPVLDFATPAVLFDGYRYQCVVNGLCGEAVSREVSLKVNKAQLSVKANDAERVYGDTNPEFSATISGFRNGENMATSGVMGMPSFRTSATKDSAAGFYDIVPEVGSLQASNYAFQFMNGTLTIGKASLLISAENKSRAYGEPNPDFTATYAGFKNGENWETSGIRGNIGYSTAATDTSSVGEYDILSGVGSLMSNNYRFDFVKGKLTIGKAMLMVQAEDLEKVYGDPNPELKATFLGFKNGQDISNAGVTGTPELSTLAETLSNVGVYDIEVSAANLWAKNYDFRVAKGRLNIRRATLTVAAENKSREYGVRNPDFTSLVSGFRHGQSFASGAASGSPVLSTLADTLTDVGEYDIDIAQGTLSSGNYEFKLEKGKLFITQASVLVKADNQFREYGEANPDFTATFSGFRNGQQFGNSGISGNPVYSTLADAFSEVGEYDIVVSPGSLVSRNYAFQMAPGKLKIGQAQLTVTAEDQSREYGEPNPDLTFNFSGFRNGQSINSSDVEGLPVVSTLVNEWTDAGDYDITIAPGTLISRNYAFNLVKGKLTIRQAIVNVLAEDKERIYGDMNPPFTAVFIGFKNGQDFSGSGIKGSPVMSTLADSLSDVGDYDINIAPGSLVSQNYAFKFGKGNLKVRKATLFITADHQTKYYATPNPELTVTVTGFKNGQTFAAPAVAGSLNIATEADLRSPVGIYPIEVSSGSLNAKNYNFQFTNGNLAIDKAFVTVRADDKNRIYGEENPKLTATYIGLASWENYSSSGILGDVLLSTSATSSSQAGTYPITAELGTLTASNYAFRFENGELAVGKAILTISALDRTKVYGDELPELTLTFNGFRNEETIESGMAVAGAPDISTPVTRFSAVGEYDITVSEGTLSAANYAFRFIPGKLNVTKALLQVTAEDQSRLYGESNPALTATFTGFKNDENFENSGINGLPALSTLATISSSVGEYPIEIGEGMLTSRNYDFTFVKGKLSIGKAPLKIIAADQSREYGEPNPSLTFTYTGFRNGDAPGSALVSGEPVLATIATFTTGAGVYPITVSPGTFTAGNYEVEYIGGNLTINKALITVTAEDLQKAYGDENPVLTFRYEGYKNNETESSSGLKGSPELSTTALVGSPVGTYPITVANGTLLSDNYRFSFIPGNLVIGKATVTVTAENRSKVYGDENPELTFVFSGIKNGQQVADTDILGQPSLSAAVSRTTPVGQYPISIDMGSLSSSNYLFTLVPGQLTVEKAPLTISVGSYSRVYGDANPDFTASFAGFKNGETMVSSGMAGAIAIATLAVPSTKPGEYDITPSQGSLTAANYSFRFIPGKLKIEKAHLLIAAEYKARHYGSPNPELTVEYSGFKNGEVFEFSDLKGAPLVTTDAAPASLIGVYDIQVSIGSLVSDNYTFDVRDATLTVEKAILTVKADNKSRVFGVANPNLTFTYSGFANGETLQTSGVLGNPEIFTLATAESPAGIYDIFVSPGSLAASNYEFNLVLGKLVIGRSLITIVAHDKVKTYGERNPELTYSVTGFVNEETLITSDIKGLPEITTTVTQQTGAGVYDISLSIGNLSSENYVFEFVKGKLTVQKARITVAAEDKSRIYGQTNPEFTAIYSGFVLDQNLATSGIIGLPLFATSATTASPAGEYIIRGSEGTMVSNNYEFTFTDARLNIAKAALRISAESKTRKYGEPNPELTLSFNGFANNDNFTSSGIIGYPNLTTLAIKTSPVGIYDININEGNLASDKYYFVLEKGRLEVTKAQLKITAESKFRKYGEANPELTLAYEGFVNDEDLTRSGILGAPSLYTEATPTSTAGAYDISINTGTLASSNYAFEFIPGKLNIGKAILSITAEDQSRIYGSMNPTFSVRYSGFVNGETLASSGILGSPQLSTIATPSTGVGSYDINIVTGSLSSANYVFNLVKGTLRIEKAVLDIIADNKQKAYGSALPDLTASYVGFVNGENLFSSGVDGLPRIATTATAESAVGTYPINIETGSLFSANYVFNFKNGSLVVGKAMLTVTAVSQSKVYGEAVPELSYTLAGFVNGESVTSSGINGLPSLTTSAAANSSPGTYPIVIEQGSMASERYTFNLVPGTLTVSKAVLRVTADNKSKIYGSANPLLTVTYNGFVNGESLEASDLVGAASVSTAVKSNTPAGEYPITISYGTLTSSNYTIVYTSGTLTVTKAPLTITAANASRFYGSANPSFSYAITGFVNSEDLASSGVIGMPLLTSSATTASSVGSYDIEPSIGSLNANNYSFNFVKGSLAVNKVNLTIQAQDASRAYGAPNPSFTAVFNGFVNGETLSNSGIQGEAQFTTNATVTSMVGNYVLTPAIGTLTSRNYNFTTFNNGTLTITKANLTITADDQSRVYGASNPMLTYTMTGFVNNETMQTAALNGLPTLSTAANTGTNVGVYPIVIGMGTMASINYNLNLVNGNLTIRKATVTVTAENSSRTYGAQDPVFSAAYGGFVNGQSLATSGITGSPSFTTTATATSPVGFYDINPSSGTLGAPNYEFAFAKGTLSITKASLKVTAEDKFKAYGDSLPLFTASFNGFVNGENIASSGINGSPEMTTAATASSSLGTYIINISAGSLAAQNYSFAFTSGNLVIGKAVITVTAESKRKTYGDVNPSFTYTLNGFVNGETMATSGVAGIPVMSTPAISTSPAGDYDITVTAGTMASSKYDFRFVKGTLKVEKAVLTVIPEPKMREYGAADPEFTATYQGFVNGDILSTAGISGIASLSTNATVSSPVGNYDIHGQLGTLLSRNYDFIFAKGTLTVGKAPLVVKGDDLQRAYGAENPSLTYTITGYVNGESLATSGITGTPDISTAATPASELGTYELATTEGTLQAGNYKFVYRNGSLTIGKATITFTATDLSKPYGAATPTLSYVISGFVNGETLASSGITGAPVLFSEVDDRSSGGVYDITLQMGSLAAKNYQFNLVNGKFTVTKIPLTVTAEPKSRIYGAANPKFTATYSGFVNGETLLTSGINGFPSYTTPATVGSSVGTYDINIGQGSLISANYAFQFVKGNLTINKAMLSVTADNKNKLYGAANPLLSATLSGFVNGETLASSGVTGSAALTTSASVSSPVGRYDIEPSAGTLASGNYSFNYMKGSLMVNKATLIITPDNKTKIYSTANPALSVTYSGFVNGEVFATSGLSGEPFITTTATEETPVGEYDITASIGSLNSSNYLFIFNKGTLTIAKAVLTVSANNASKIYGEENPEFTATITGLVSGETMASIGLSGTPRFTTLANASSAVGAYEINVEQGSLSAPNYAFNFEKGVLIVDKAMLTVTADNMSRGYGAANPTFTVSYSGFVNNETLAFSGVSGRPSLVTTATATSSVGNYPIYTNLGSLASNNYNFTFVNGTLTVGKATITVTAENKNRVYGSENPVLTATYSGFVNGQNMLTSGITGAPSLITTATTASPVGTYEIGLSMGSLQSANYSFNFIKGALFVGKATILVTPEEKFRAYGDENPEFTAAYSGFVNGETLANSGINGQPVMGTAAVKNTPVGVYDITIANGNLNAANYTFSFATGKLNIRKALVNVIADNQFKKYGSMNPALTVSYTGFVNGETLATSGITGTPGIITTALLNSPLGSYPITANLGNMSASNYDFNFVNGILTIGKATLTVRADDKSRTYGSEDPNFTAVISGFVNGETLSTSDVKGMPAFTTNATATSPVGVYAIAPDLGSLNSNNYEFQYVSGKLAVTKAMLLVTADHKSKVYGAVNPELTVSISGYKNGENFSTAGLRGAAGLMTPATINSSVGSYDIVSSLGTLTAGNYEFSFAPGILTVGKATITVAADPKSKIYGSANPDLTYTLNGFVNGQVLATSGITGAPILTTGVTRQSGVNVYDIQITPGTLAAGNYDFIMTKGVFTVEKATLSITADNKFRIYGDENPPLTVTYSGFVNGETLSSSGVTGTAGVGTEAVATTPAGNHAILPVAGTLAAANYSFRLIPGTLTIGKAGLTVMVDNKNRKFGEPNPEFTVTYTGFRNGETLKTSDLSGVPALVTEASQVSSVGSYDIMIGGGTLASNNYSFNLVSGVLVIGKTTLTVMADNKAKTYGEANPALTYSFSGNAGEPVQTNFITGAPALITTADRFSDVGNYDINIAAGTLASVNYDFVVATGKLAIGKATLNVRAENKSRKYGTTNPEFTASITGYVLGQDFSSAAILGAPGFTTTANELTSVGDYPIQVNGGSLEARNYAFNMINGTLSIDKAVLTVVAEHKSRSYGQPNPEFTPAYNGFMNGESLASSGVTGAPQFATQANSLSPVGRYDIVPSPGSLNATNYRFEFGNGLLTVGKARITVKADNQTKIYGTPNPGLTFTYNGFVNNETALTSDIKGLPAIATSAEVSSPVGTYPIDALLGTLFSNNYEFAFDKGVLSITKAMITVRVTDTVKAYGAMNPVFTASYTGFVNGETMSTSKVSGQPVFTTRATEISWMGTYPVFIDKGSLASGNYDFTLVNGTLTVGPPTCTTSGTLVVSDKCYGSEIALTYNNTFAPGPYTLMINDSAYYNVYSGVPFNTGTVARNMMESVFGDQEVGQNSSAVGSNAIEVGVRIRPNVEGQITGIRFYKQSANTGTHVGSLWSTDGTLLARATFTNESETGWQEVLFSNPVEVIPGATYVASYFAPKGNYAYTPNAFRDNRKTNRSGSLTALRASDGGNGVFRMGGGYPNQFSADNGNYHVDVLFSNTNHTNRFALTGVIGATGCAALGEPIQTLEINIVPVIDISLSKNDPVCPEGGSGSINMNGVGCNSPFAYSIDNGVTYHSNGFFEGLGPGSYKIRIKDAGNFAKDTTVTLSLEAAVWTGSVSSDWHNAANWSTQQVPGPNTHVIIPPTGKECLIISADVTVASVQVWEGSIFRTQNNRKLTLTGKCATLPNQ